MLIGKEKNNKIVEIVMTMPEGNVRKTGKIRKWGKK